jgi:hypothetical protein
MTKISSEVREELVRALAHRYRESDRLAKRRILDEFVALTGYHRASSRSCPSWSTRSSVTATWSSTPQGAKSSCP